MPNNPNLSQELPKVAQVAAKTAQNYLQLQLLGSDDDDGFRALGDWSKVIIRNIPTTCQVYLEI